MTMEEKENMVKELYSHQFSQWDLANNVIYDICQKYRLHTKADEIVAKVWIIGRTYAAAIERTSSLKVQYFGENSVADVLQKNGEQLDRMISEIENQPMCENTMVGCMLLHGYLMKLFEAITGMKKRSLASKYLHFHLPNLFYIYDSNAMQSCNKKIKEMHIEYKSTHQRIKVQLEASGQFFDYEYLNFFVKMFCLQSELAISDVGIIDHFPRIMDNLLLNI